jgi:hypothetical protein
VYVRILCDPVLSVHLITGQWVRDHPDLIIIGGAGVVATALAPVLVPLILNGAGFTAGACSPLPSPLPPPACSRSSGGSRARDSASPRG